MAQRIRAREKTVKAMSWSLRFISLVEISTIFMPKTRMAAMAAQMKRAKSTTDSGSEMGYSQAYWAGRSFTFRRKVVV